MLIVKRGIGQFVDLKTEDGKRIAQIMVCDVQKQFVKLGIQAGKEIVIVRGSAIEGVPEVDDEDTMIGGVSDRK